MADVIRKAVNKFTKGLVMDFSPENTQNEVLTNALNATLLTFNGNELSLQNDMGNGRVETAHLPDGYMPVGTCEYGGIIYIVSYNPLEDKSQIGCFPSPERNVSNDELGIPNKRISRSDFQEVDDYGNPSQDGIIKNNTQCVLLRNDPLNPGDKFLICTNPEIYNEKLADLLVDRHDGYYEGSANWDPHGFEPIKHPMIALNVVSIEDSGKIIYLNSDIRQYDKVVTNSGYEDIFRYHMLGSMPDAGPNKYDQEAVDIDEYRDVLSSGYSVFKSKTSGKLAILAELVMIDSYSVTHSLQPRKDLDGNIIDGSFDIIIHTDVSPKLNKDNYNTAPKLQYYYLENSQGYLQVQEPYNSVNTTRTLFTTTRSTSGMMVAHINTDFLATKLDRIYEPIDSAIAEKFKDVPLENVSQFNFPRPFTYHGRMNHNEGAQGNAYSKFTEYQYHRIDKSQVVNNLDYYSQIQAKFYYYEEDEDKDPKEFKENVINTAYTYYIKTVTPDYKDAERKIEYKNQPLYKILARPFLADNAILRDNTIEKFKYQEIHSYIEATNADLSSEEKLYYTEDGGQTYLQLTEDPKEGVTYYVLVIENNLVSIGFTVAPGTVPGDIYYYKDDPIYVEATKEEKDKYYDFETYPLTSNKPYGSPLTLYREIEEAIFVEATQAQIDNYKEWYITLYYKTDYKPITRMDLYNKPNQVFVTFNKDTYVSRDKFVPNTDYNWINGQNEPEEKFPKDYPIFIYELSEFIPEERPLNDDLVTNESDYYNYHDVKLANIQLPSVVVNNGLDLPFKYDYTLVPCMSYGKLQHLAVSNTVDFSKLHAFNQSDFTTWKYRIDENQLRLTFGADVYDTYENYKVDGIILEFYDCWGFAGSLEILDKKSYSGIFTKIIPLNSFRALSRKKIEKNSQHEDFKRNINIKETEEGNFTFNEQVIFRAGSIFNIEKGWEAIPDINEKTGEENNDCGTLYSNILYGVKAYLRRTTDKGVEFIKKRDFFLYTLPIYNEYYYTTQDFSNLYNPELELVLTYKLKDTSSKNPYSSDIINNGYNNIDSDNVSSYLGGFYDTSKSTSLDLIKYYKYSGITDLYLEVGLKKDYESLNISCHSDINNCYYCTLQLLSDDKKVFTVDSGIEGLKGASQTLNYNNLIEEDVNKIGFKGQNNTYTSIYKTPGSIYNANFINHEGTSPIQIKYEFIVGYTINISDIKRTQVPATTVCALFHKKPTGEYNYEDFGVYEQQDTNGELNQDGTPKTRLLSSAMFYNEGTSEKEVFGICQQKQLTSHMGDQCHIITSVEQDAYEIKSAGKLNSGDPLKQLVGHIGKLSFCQPHVHGLSENNGVNIYVSNSGTGFGIAPEYGDWKVRDQSDVAHGDDYDDTQGIVPMDLLYQQPLYNLSLNTKNAINYNSEFISTLDWSLTQGKIAGCDLTDDKDVKWSDYQTMREFTGFSGSQIATFNEKLIKTMSSVYAYNPDYDSLTVNAGNITLQNYNPSFNSNILSIDSQFDFRGQSLNDFIYLGPIKFSNYLKYLNQFSLSSYGDSIKITKEEKQEDGTYIDVILEQIQLTPNLDYCGTQDSYYLVSSLTYNTPVPREIEQELEFSASNITVIKHTNGDNRFMQGSPNKKLLYGYHPKFKKMIQLDASNYVISADGTLTLSNDIVENIPGSAEFTSEIYKNLFRGTYTFDHTLTNASGKKANLKIGFNLNWFGDDSEFSELQYGEDGVFVAAQSTYETSNFGFNLLPSLYVVTSDKEYKYSIKVESIEIETEARLLNDKVSLYGYPIPLYNQAYDSLKLLVSGNDYQSVTLADYTGKNITQPVNTYLAAYDTLSLVSFNGSYTNKGTVFVDESGNISVKFQRNSSTGPSSYIIGLLNFKIKKINFIITQTSKLELTPEYFITTTATKQYGDFSNHKYTIRSEYNKARLRGSSILINDLVYEPNPDGHRLFMKNNLCVYNPLHRGKIYYRYLQTIQNGSGESDNTYHESWEYNKTKYLNNLFIFTGPCFTSDNLNYNPEIDG